MKQDKQNSADIKAILRSAADWQPEADMPVGLIGSALQNRGRRRFQWGSGVGLALTSAAVALLVIVAIAQRDNNRVTPNSQETASQLNPNPKRDDLNQHATALIDSASQGGREKIRINDQKPIQTALATKELRAKIERNLQNRRIRRSVKRRKPIWTHQTVAVQETGLVAAGWDYMRTADGDIVGEPVLVEMPVARGISVSPASYEQAQ
jgi:hypothetical protein